MREISREGAMQSIVGERTSEKEQREAVRWVWPCFVQLSKEVSMANATRARKRAVVDEVSELRRS